MRPPTHDLEVAVLLYRLGTTGAYPPGVRSDVAFLSLLRDIPGAAAQDLTRELALVAELRRLAPAKGRGRTRWSRYISVITGWDDARVEGAVSLAEATELVKIDSSPGGLPS